jgi:hypothetical protein
MKKCNGARRNRTRIEENALRFPSRGRRIAIWVRTAPSRATNSDGYTAFHAAAISCHLARHAEPLPIIGPCRDPAWHLAQPSGRHRQAATQVASQGAGRQRGLIDMGDELHTAAWWRAAYSARDNAWLAASAMLLPCHCCGAGLVQHGNWPGTEPSLPPDGGSRPDDAGLGAERLAGLHGRPSLYAFQWRHAPWITEWRSALAAQPPCNL